MFSCSTCSTGFTCAQVDVNGPSTHPVFAFLKKELPESYGGGGGKAPGKDLGWNFQVGAGQG